MEYVLLREITNAYGKQFLQLSPFDSSCYLRVKAQTASTLFNRDAYATLSTFSINVCPDQPARPCNLSWLDADPCILKDDFKKRL